MTTGTLQPIRPLRESVSIPGQFLSSASSTELHSLTEAESLVDWLEREGARNVEAELLNNGKVRVTWW